MLVSSIEPEPVVRVNIEMSSVVHIDAGHRQLSCIQCICAEIPYTSRSVFVCSQQISPIVPAIDTPRVSFACYCFRIEFFFAEVVVI